MILEALSSLYRKIFEEVMMVNNEKGQSLVEFCLIVPLFLLMIIAMINGGLAYADYLQYSTAVREAARDIAIQDKDKRNALITGLNSNADNTLHQYVNPLTNFFNARFSVQQIEDDIAGNENGNGGLENNTKMRFVLVRVDLNFTDDVSIIPAPLRQLRPLQCTMPIEQELEDDE